MNEHLSLSSRTLLVPRRAGLSAGHDQTLEVLVRVQAADAAPGEARLRPQQAIALVIDRSGSMAGRPLAEARRCAELVVARLRPCDSVSVVQFDNRVQRLWPAVPLGDGDAVRAAIARIHDGGNTNLHGGWLDGADSLADVPAPGLRRVILLSDGQANDGVTDDAVIAAQCAAYAANGISTSTYGLGNSFNEDLMVAMARSGGGNHYYGSTADDLMDPFQQELDLLANLALREVTLRVSVPDGIQVEMLNAIASVESGWRLPDLAWGAEAWALLRMTVPAAALPSVGGRLPLLRASVIGRSLDGEPVEIEQTGLALPVLTPAAFGDLPEDALVQRRASELAAGAELTRMRSAAQANDWATVDALLAAARLAFAGNEWVSAMLAAMADLADQRSRERLMKESRYSSARLETRLVPKNEMDLDFSDVEVPRYLRCKPLAGKARP